jgi:hypothetical protein
MTLDFSKVQIIKGLPDPKSKYWENFHDETLTSKILLPSDSEVFEMFKPDCNLSYTALYDGKIMATSATCEYKEYSANVKSVYDRLINDPKLSEGAKKFLQLNQSACETFNIFVDPKKTSFHNAGLCVDRNFRKCKIMYKSELMSVGQMMFNAKLSELIIRYPNMQLFTNANNGGSIKVFESVQNMINIRNIPYDKIQIDHPGCFASFIYQ